MNPVVTAGTTFINAIGLSFSLAMALLLLCLPRRYAIVPIIVLICYMTMGERVMIAGLNFTMLRILILFGWLRLLMRHELRRMRWNSVDKVVVAWTIVRTINYTLVWGDSAALINRLGYAYDIVGTYFLFRFLLCEPEDLYRVIRYLAIFLAPVAVLIVGEKITGRNSFAIFGGVPLLSDVRDGVLRCQGPFSHPILAGTFGATTLPLFLALYWKQRPNRALATMGAISALVIIAMAGSSGPALAGFAGILGLLFWPMRRRMRIVRWGCVLVLVALQFAMKSPIWFVLARLTVFSGSTGWYRGFLIDMAARHMNEWWLIGTNAATQWHFYLADVTNQYVAEGFDGGLLAMGLFIAILAQSFGAVGRTIRSGKKSVSIKHLTWALGAALLAHTVTFISVTYFDQNFVMLYFVLAAISTAGAVQVSTAVKSATRQPDPAVPLCLAPLLNR